MVDYQEEHYEGRTIVRDTDGKIRSTRISPETASEMGKKRWSKPRAETSGTLLQEAGFENPEDAPEHLRVLADIASSGRSGAVAALRDILRLTRRNEQYEPPKEGERCPLCRLSRLDAIARIDAFEIGVLELAKRYRESDEHRQP